MSKTPAVFIMAFGAANASPVMADEGPPSTSFLGPNVERRGWRAFQAVRKLPSKFALEDIFLCHAPVVATSQSCNGRRRPTICAFSGPGQQGVDGGPSPAMTERSRRKKPFSAKSVGESFHTVCFARHDSGIDRRHFGKTKTAGKNCIPNLDRSC